jgi:uncharacterized protein
MKLSKVAAAVAALLATDAKPTEAQIMAACIAADKKGKDEGGLGNVEIQNKAKDKAKDSKEDDEKKGEDEFPEKKEDKAEDGKDDPEATNDEDPDMESGMDDVQPAQKPDKARAGEMPAKDKKGMDAKGVADLIAANDAKHVAAREVEPILGVVAYDSAEAYYKAALTKLGVDTAGVHASAFPSLLKLARDKTDAQTPVMASDSAQVSAMAKLIPSYNRLK